MTECTELVADLNIEVNPSKLSHTRSDTSEAFYLHSDAELWPEPLQSPRPLTLAQRRLLRRACSVFGERVREVEQDLNHSLSAQGASTCTGELREHAAALEEEAKALRAEWHAWIERELPKVAAPGHASLPPSPLQSLTARDIIPVQVQGERWFCAVAFRVGGELDAAERYTGPLRRGPIEAREDAVRLRKALAGLVEPTSFVATSLSSADDVERNASAAPRIPARSSKPRALEREEPTAIAPVPCMPVLCDPEVVPALSATASCALPHSGASASTQAARSLLAGLVKRDLATGFPTKKKAELEAAPGGTLSRWLMPIPKAAEPVREKDESKRGIAGSLDKWFAPASKSGPGGKTQPVLAPGLGTSSVAPTEGVRTVPGSLSNWLKPVSRSSASPLAEEGGIVEPAAKRLRGNDADLTRAGGA